MLPSFRRKPESSCERSEGKNKLKKRIPCLKFFFKISTTFTVARQLFFSRYRSQLDSGFRRNDAGDFGFEKRSYEKISANEEEELEICSLYR